MKLLAFDIESCTGGANDGSLCEFGYCVADETFTISEENNIIVNPKPDRFKLSRNGEEATIKLSHTEAEYRAAPRFNEQYKKIKALFSDGAVAVLFEGVNDIGYLNGACRAYGLEPIKFKYLDATLFCSIMEGERNRHGLAYWGEKFKVEFTEHSADEDSRATLLVVKGVLDSFEMSLEEGIEKFGITFGENLGADYQVCESDYLAKKGIVMQRGSKRNRTLVNEFVKTLVRPQKIIKTKYSGKNITFNYKLEYGDPLLARRVIMRLNQMGAKYQGNAKWANAFVYREGLDACNKMPVINDRIKRGAKIMVVEEKQFLSELGELPELKFDDERILREYRRDQKRERYRKQAKAEAQARAIADRTHIQPERPENPEN